MRDERRSQTPPAVHVEGREQPEQDETGDHVRGPDVVADDAVVDAHDGPGDHDLDEAARAAALEPVQDEAADRDLLPEGEDHADAHHNGALPRPGEGIPAAREVPDPAQPSRRRNLQDK